MIQDMKNGGTIILNGDDDILSGCGPIKGVAPQFFGIGKNNEFYADNITSLGLKGTSCTIHLPSGECFDCTVRCPEHTWYQMPFPEQLLDIIST